MECRFPFSRKIIGQALLSGIFFYRGVWYTLPNISEAIEVENNMLGLKRGTVKLVEHQDNWQIEAKQTIAELKRLLGNTAIDIQHIGSTAISSIHAKPIIDIVIGMRDPTDIMPYVDTLKRGHYIFRGEDVPGQLLFVKGDFESDIRTHHIHVVKWNGIDWNNYINFRDYLNAFPEKAKRYDMCKLNLAKQFPQERGSYTKGKQHLVSALLKEAKLWKSKQ